MSKTYDMRSEPNNSIPRLGVACAEQDQNGLSAGLRSDRKAVYYTIGATRIATVTGVACLQLWLASTLGPEPYGRFVVGYSAAWMLATLAIRGADSSTMRWVSASLAKRETGHDADLVAVARRDAAITSLTASALMGLAGLGLSRLLEQPDLGYVLLAASPLVALVSMTRVYEATARAVGMPLLGSVSSWLAPWLVLGTLQTRGILSGEGLTPAMVLLVQVVCYAGLAVTLRCVVGVSARVFFTPRYRDIDEEAAYEARRQSVPFILMAGAITSQAHGMTLLAGACLGPAVAGQYGVAARLSALLLLGSEAAAVVAGPRFSAAHALGDRFRLQALARDTVLFSFSVAAIGSLVVFFAGHDLLALVGDAYTDAYTPLLILSAGALINASCGLVGLMLNMTGHAWVTLRGMLAGAGVGLTGVALLAPALGLPGVCLGAAAGVVVWNATLSHAVWKRLGVISHLGSLVAKAQDQENSLASPFEAKGTA